MAAVMSSYGNNNSRSRVSEVEVRRVRWRDGLVNKRRTFKIILRLCPNLLQERLKNELEQLVKDIWRVGDPAKPQVPFGELFDDDDVQQHYEGLAATLKAAKKRECMLCVCAQRLSSFSFVA